MIIYDYHGLLPHFANILVTVTLGDGNYYLFLAKAIFLGKTLKTPSPSVTVTKRHPP